MPAAVELQFSGYRAVGDQLNCSANKNNLLAKWSFWYSEAKSLNE